MKAFPVSPNRGTSKSSLRENLEKGFTLVELMVVILIISLMATLAITTLGPKIFKSKKTIARANMKEIDNAIEMFYADQGKLPQGLQDLITRPGWAREWPNEGYLKTLPKDPWTHDYVYRVPGANNRKYDILSLGADGAQGGAGDDNDIPLYDEETNP